MGAPDAVKSVTMKAKDTHIKMSEEGVRSGTEGFNLERILAELGSFGKYQVLVLLLLAFRDSFLNMCNFNYVFTAAEVHFRCVVPECESTDGSYNASWTPYALTNNTDTCHRMVPVEEAGWNSTVRGQRATCTPANFATNRTVTCNQVVYEDYNSIVAEFDLGCEPWKRTLIGTVHNLGLVFSFVISGLVSDKYGRKVVIVCTPLAVGLVGLAKSFSVSYHMLLVLEFLETALGYGNASMVLSLELVSQKQRVWFSCISDILASLGSAFFGIIAWKIPYWRHMMRAIYTPLLIVVFYIWVFDEGVRWLLAHGRCDEAARVLHKVAKVNNVELSHKAKLMLSNITTVNNTTDESEGGRWALCDALRSRRVCGRVLLLAASFVCGTFVYSGTIVTAASASLAGDPRLNFSAMLLAAVPTRLLTALTLTKFGRRAPICVAYALCCVFFFTSAFVSKATWWSSVCLYVAGKMCSSYGMFALCVVSLEAFPTRARNSLANAASTAGRLGTVLAPQAPLLEQYAAGLTSLVFAAAAAGAALLALLLPDTRRALPADRAPPPPADLAPAPPADRAPPPPADLAPAPPADRAPPPPADLAPAPPADRAPPPPADLAPAPPADRAPPPPADLAPAPPADRAPPPPADLAPAPPADRAPPPPADLAPAPPADRAPPPPADLAPAPPADRAPPPPADLAPAPPADRAPPPPADLAPAPPADRAPPPPADLAPAPPADRAPPPPADLAPAPPADRAPPPPADLAPAPPADRAPPPPADLAPAPPADRAPPPPADLAPPPPADLAPPAPSAPPAPRKLPL